MLFQGGETPQKVLYLISASNSVDKMSNRYESIKTVTEPAQKKQGRLGGQSSLRWQLPR
jgi:hypothetical protein